MWLPFVRNIKKDGRPGEVAQREKELGSEGLEPCGGNQSYGLTSQNYKTVKKIIQKSKPTM